MGAKICQNVCLRILSVPRSSQFSSSYALGKLLASRNILCPRTNILAYFRAKWRLLFTYQDRRHGLCLADCESGHGKHVVLSDAGRLATNRLTPFSLQPRSQQHCYFLVHLREWGLIDFWLGVNWLGDNQHRAYWLATLFPSNVYSIKDETTTATWY